MSNPNFKKAGAAAGGGDTVLESRHLIGLFLGVVVLCGVFFTLGYVMGRTQYESSVNAATNRRVHPPARTDVAAQPAGAAQAGQPVIPGGGIPPEWEFYKAGRSKQPVAGSPSTSSGPSNTEHKPIVDSVVAAPAGSAPPKVSAVTPKAPGVAASPTAAKSLSKPPLAPKGSVALQVAALTREGDALALAEALQQKQFPSYVLTWGTGNLFRVQVGPYADVESANLAKRALEREGFKAIVRR